MWSNLHDLPLLGTWINSACIRRCTRARAPLCTPRRTSSPRRRSRSSCIKRSASPPSTSECMPWTEKCSGMKHSANVLSPWAPSSVSSPVAHPSRFQVEREINIHIGLEHENIIRLFAAFEDEKNFYMVQELGAGGDLFHKIQLEGR